MPIKNLKLKIFFLAIIFGGIFGVAEKTFGATINAVSCSQIDVQSAIDASVSGDTVSVPAGDCTWSSEVTIPDSKGITIEANSSTISGRLVFNQNYDTSTRITGFNFISGNAVYVAGIKTSAPFRVDHNTFRVTEGSSILLEVEGNAPGLVDNNSFNAPTNSEMIHNYGMGAVDASGWNDDIIPGSADAVYIEDNIFTNNDPSFGTADPAYFWGNSSVQSYYGARTVFRHNTLNMSQIDQHGTPGMIGARWWEIYDNTFNNGVPHASQCCFISLRAGSGVVFNNHHTGVNQDGNSIDLYEEDSGYPALYQIGRGKNQALDPAYVWDNDLFFSVDSQTPNMVQENRDYYLFAKPDYIPYTYPHPLRNESGDSTPPASPSGLAVD